MKIVIYTNILTPYRKHFYDLIYNQCKKNGDEFYVYVMAPTEPGRNWFYDDLKMEYTVLLENKTITKSTISIHFNKNLKEKLTMLKPDLVICAGSYLCPGVWKVLSLQKKLGYKCMFWSESHLSEQRNYSRVKLWVRDNIRKIFYSKFDGFLYAGKKSKDFIEKYSIEDKKMVFCPNIINNIAFNDAVKFKESKLEEIKNKYSIDKNKINFICPARLISVKGIEEFLESIIKYPQKDRIRIYLAGDGDRKDAIEKISSENGIDVRFLGYKNQNEIIELYAACDFFLMPSLSDANPLTCVEALWAGKPLLVSNHVGNYPEAVNIGENGYVFSCEDRTSIVEILNEIIDKDCEWYINAKMESLRIADSIYNPEKNVERILNKWKK